MLETAKGVHTTQIVLDALDLATDITNIETKSPSQVKQAVKGVAVRTMT